MPTFSIIVPVYKVEDYLPKCIDSILAQTCQNFELLLIDDGSPDGCGKICDAYAAKSPLVRAIHQDNAGAGAARNHGISLAQGDYLLFVDGDDYLSANMLEALSGEIQRNPADLMLFGAFVEKNGRHVGQLHENVPAGQLLEISAQPTLYFGVMAPWNRAYRRGLFTENHIEFPSKVWYEDIRVVTKLLAVAKTAVRLPACYYHYLQRDGSTMNNRNADRNGEILTAFDDILGWFQKEGYYQANQKALEFQAILHIYLAATVRLVLIDFRHPLVEKFSQYMEEHFPNYQQNPFLPTLDNNKKLIFKLLLKRRYRTIRLIFRVKDFLGK